MGSKMLKRFVLSALSFCMVWSQINVVNVNATNSLSTTDATVVAENYRTELSDEEKAILANDSINSTEYKFVVPTKENNLVTVDTDNKTLVAKTHTDAEGNEWKPATVIITESTGENSFELDDEGFCEFFAESKNYSIEVLYEAKATIDAETQSRLLNTPHYLVSMY